MLKFTEAELEDMRKWDEQVDRGFAREQREYQREYRREYYRKNRDKINAYNRERYREKKIAACAATLSDERKL